LLHLSVNTLALVSGTVTLSLPIGLGLAVLLFRTSLGGRQFFLFLLALGLFVPLPIIVSSWQSFFGADGWLPLGFWHGPDYRPWMTGLGPAIWIHALAAIPWITFIVGIGLTWVEPELEDEAAQVVGPWRVLFLVTLPRVRASLLAAVLFVVLQTAGEISVTDMMLVSTLAEEGHTQFTLGDRAALARTLIVSFPSLLLTWAAVLGILSHLENALPPLAPPFRSHRALTLGPAWLRFISVVGLVIFLAVPIMSLLWKLGLAGEPREWRLTVAWHFLHAEAMLKGTDLLAMIGTTFVTGFLVAGLALMGCWLARDSRWFRGLLFGILTWAWVTPGPVVGIGLHELILLLPPGPWKELLYYGPSPVPLMWAQAIRALPIVVVFLWPIVRMIPREMFEEARLHGAGALSEWLHVVWPMARRAFAVTVLAACALCLGEVAASVRVGTPGCESFTMLLFDRMHYGVENTLAALCVLMLGSLAIIGIVGGCVSVWMRPYQP
jgi:iron(III) transport system permease protein